MPNNLNSLLQRVGKMDPALARDLRSEVDYLAKRREFGLNFEKHRPETVELHGRPVRVGDKVRFIAPRGSNEPVRRDIWLVQSLQRTKTDVRASLVHQGGDETVERYVGDLVAVADFRDTIYPGLTSTGTIERGGDKPFHAVINSENYHALEAMLFTWHGSIDAIYIDPPYNTGASDWMYNNNYVDSDDSFRHSKWLSFMERRLRLAKKLLNPDNSVLIVTIDEKEYLRLGLLLEQTFLGCKIQMISSVIKPGGTSRTKEFSRVEEYIYFVFLGSAELARTHDNMLSVATAKDAVVPLTESDLWEGMIRRGIGVVRAQRPKQFYPIYIDPDRGRILEAGEPLPLEVNRDSAPRLSGLVTVWPIKDDGTEGFWQLSPSGLEKARQRGTVRVGGFNAKTGQWRIQYMKATKAKAVENGTVAIRGKDENGVVILDLANSALSSASTPRTVWNKASHDASVGGAGLLNRLLPGRKFPFPKSLYAVEDSLRFFVSDKPDAVILDFFGGSGTTAHAVFRLNRQDNGRRRAILVTNNEVSAKEQRALRRQGYRPADPEWEALGICAYITRPRIVTAVSGLTPDGDLLQGDYGFGDTFPMRDGFDENVEFFDLTYQDPQLVELDLACGAVAPLLWMRAGSEGRRIDHPNDTFDIADTYAVLFSVDASSDFVIACAKADRLRMAYIVTDDEKQFQMIAGALPPGIKPVRLYESYLRTFEINTGKE